MSSSIAVRTFLIYKVTSQPLIPRFRRVLQSLLGTLLGIATETYCRDTHAILDCKRLRRGAICVAYKS